MIPTETSYKVLKYLVKLSAEKTLPKNYENDTLMLHLVERKYLSSPKESPNKFFKTKDFDETFAEEIFPSFQKYNSFIKKYQIEGLENYFSIQELESLIRIENDREQILDSEKSQKEIATLYFDSAKYLTKSSRLYDAVLKVLEIPELPVDEHDQQFLWILHCKNKTPKAIILCENDNKIRKPRLNDVELWYAGGRNTAKLKFINEPAIPFYYLCDWDNRGIEIYQDIKRNIFPNIEIIIPQETIKFLDVKSEWKVKIDLLLFSNEAKKVLEKLIPEKWIEEESICHKLFKK